MKPILFFAILALSYNAFAQSGHPAFNQQYQTTNSLEKIQDIMDDGGWKTSYIYSEEKLGQSLKHQAHFTGSTIQIYDSIYEWQWDALSLPWLVKSKIINMVYDANNNLSSYISQNWNETSWVNSFRETFTYDGNNNETSFILQSWNDNVWVNSERTSMTYDVSNNLTNYLYQTWNGSGWLNSYHYSFSYDANDNPINYLYQTWNGNAWVNNYQYTYTYDVSNNLIMKFGQSSNGSTWENSVKYTYTYDANYNEISFIRQGWNNNEWENSAQYSFTYDESNNRTSEVGQYWMSGNWENSFKSIFSYDENNNQSSEVGQYWMGGTWVLQSQFNITYDPSNFKISDLIRLWNSTGTEIIAGDSTYYYFHTVLGIDDLIANEGNISVYPNPGNGKFTIGSNRKLSAIEVFNLQGELIQSDFTSDQQLSTEIDISNKPKGIYFARIYDGKEIYTRKVVVQ